MNKQRLGVIIAMIGILSVGIIAFSDSNNNGYTYVESDITQANPNISVAIGMSSLITTDISQIKDDVILTISGTVISVGDPIPWTDKSGNFLGFIPITVQIDQKVKDNTMNQRFEKEDLFVVYAGGIYEEGQFYMDGFEPQVEVGERVIFHVGYAGNGPVFEDEGAYFVKLGKYGKYKIVEDRAYNEKYPNGRSLHDALNESR